MHCDLCGHVFINSLSPGDEYMFVNWVIIGSAKGLVPVRHQAITWTSAE